ncbi:MAG: hypothetical protein JXA33_20895 [Anaerolineae bacterium]|nr:hypothetical protein [Anaerolineae bacterium]
MKQNWQSCLITNTFGIGCAAISFLLFAALTYIPSSEIQSIIKDQQDSIIFAIFTSVGGIFMLILPTKIILEFDKWLWCRRKQKAKKWGHGERYWQKYIKLQRGIGHEADLKQVKMYKAMGLVSLAVGLLIMTIIIWQTNLLKYLQFLQSVP